jgi:hypothetical protein
VFSYSEPLGFQHLGDGHRPLSLVAQGISLAASPGMIPTPHELAGFWAGRVIQVIGCIPAAVAPDEALGPHSI